MTIMPAQMCLSRYGGGPVTFIHFSYGKGVGSAPNNRVGPDNRCQILRRPMPPRPVMISVGASFASASQIVVAVLCSSPDSSGCWCRARRKAIRSASSVSAGSKVVSVTFVFRICCQEISVTVPKYSGHSHSSKPHVALSSARPIRKTISSS